jgi:hypothetical protein
MIEGGGLYGIDEVYAYHNLPGLVLGKAGSPNGCIAVSWQVLKIIVKR